MLRVSPDQDQSQNSEISRKMQHFARVVEAEAWSASSAGQQYSHAKKYSGQLSEEGIKIHFPLSWMPDSSNCTTCEMPGLFPENLN